jgi:hypothetical protein
VRGLIADGLRGRQCRAVGIGDLANSHAYPARAKNRASASSALEARADGVGTVVSRELDTLPERRDAIHVDLDVDVVGAAFVPGPPGAVAPYDLIDAASKPADTHRCRRNGRHHDETSESCAYCLRH